MIDEKTLGPWEPVFTFVANDGTNVTIHSGRLREEVLRKKPEVVLVPVDMKIAYSYIESNSILPSRVAELAERKDLDPIIYCEDGFTDGRPDIMLVDGHHRYVMAAMEGLSYIPAVILYKEFWKPFQVVGLSKISAQALKSVPVHKRNY